MEGLIKKITDTADALKQNLSDFANGKGSREGYNKSAGARARKLSLDLERLMKEFRKESCSRVKWGQKFDGKDCIR